MYCENDLPQGTSESRRVLTINFVKPGKFTIRIYCYLLPAELEIRVIVGEPGTFM